MANEKKNRSKVVKELLEKVEKRLGKDGAKASVGDYIRLVQLQKDLEEGEPKEIRVTWVDPEEKNAGK